MFSYRPALKLAQWSILCCMVTGCTKKTPLPGSPVGLYFNILRNGQPVSKDTLSKARYFSYNGGDKNYYPTIVNGTPNTNDGGAIYVQYFDSTANRMDSAYLFEVLVWNAYINGSPTNYFIEYPDKSTDTIALNYQAENGSKYLSLSGISINGKAGASDNAFQNKRPDLRFVYKLDK